MAVRLLDWIRHSRQPFHDPLIERMRQVLVDVDFTAVDATAARDYADAFPDGAVNLEDVRRCRPLFDNLWLEDGKGALAMQTDDRGDDVVVTATYWFTPDWHAAQVYPGALRLHLRREDYSVRADAGGVWCPHERYRQTIETRDAFQARVIWALFVCRLMNAKNARLVEHQPPRAVRKRHERMLGSPAPVVYRTIEIDPAGTRRAGARGPADAITEPQRWHKVRGHFKNYTDWWGIGKRTPPGEYWFSEHFAGDPARGVAIHDYKLAAPHG